MNERPRMPDTTPGTRPSTVRLPVIQFIKFAAVGAIGTIAHYVTLIASVSGIGMTPVAGTTVGAAVGALVNYWLNRNVTFRSIRRHAEALPRFMALAGAGIALNALAVWILTATGLHYLLAQVVATAVILFFNFLVSRTWIFRKTGP